MNALERELVYPFGDVLPEDGRTFEVGHDVRWVRMPLPFALNHVNLWLVRDRFRGREGWTLIDCGIATDAIRERWENVFADGLDGLPIVRIVCTHTHPDHVGLADWIQKRFDAPLWITTGEYTTGRVLSSRLPGIDAESSVAHFRRHGIPEGELLDGIRSRNQRYFSSLVPSMPLSYRRIRDGELLEIGGHGWQVITGAGHSPEHATLYCASLGLMFSGDMVLPRISTNVSVWELEPESNPVDWYLESLDKMHHCRDDTLVLPAHGKPFRNLHRRIQQQHAHHLERLELVLAECAKHPCSAADIMPVMFERAFDVHQTTFAMGESLAHLHALWYREQVERAIDADGVVRFRARPGAAVAAGAHSAAAVAT
jgi:glyoxylase-like metal-dependent hydrolase (beta-lactamase superfamily II)